MNIMPPVLLAANYNKIDKYSNHSDNFRRIPNNFIVQNDSVSFTSNSIRNISTVKKQH